MAKIHEEEEGANVSLVQEDGGTKNAAGENMEEQTALPVVSS